MTMIVITGATGALGSRIVDQLLIRFPAHQIGVSVRDAAKANVLADRGVRVREAQFGDTGALEAAFDGASQVLVISSNSSGSEAVAHHIAAIDAARSVGVERVLYTSHQASSSTSHFAPMPDHAATEEYLIAQGGAFTSLRNGFYASTVPFLIGRALQTGVLLAPADGPVSWTAHDDLAEAAAIALTTDRMLDGITAPLTAPTIWDLSDVAAVLSEVSGRTITRVVAEDEEWKAGLIAGGVPEGQAGFMLGMFLAMRDAEFAVTDPTLETILDRPATTLRSTLEPVVAAARP